MQKGEKNCTQEIGTIMKATVPAGSVMKIFNFVEAVPEKDIELIVRIPFFLKSSSYITNFVSIIKQAGGRIEVIEE